MKRFVGYIANKIVQSIPKSKKVAPTIKSVPPTKDIKGSVKRVYRQEESKRIDKTVASKEKMKKGKKMMREGQKELRRQIDTGTAFKFKGGKTGEKTFAIKPGENVKEKFKGLIEESKPTKKFKTAKELARENKMGGGMMGRRMGYSQGSKKGKIPTTPKEKSLAKLAPPKDRITFGDVVAGRTKGKRMQAREGTVPLNKRKSIIDKQGKRGNIVGMGTIKKLPFGNMSEEKRISKSKRKP